MKTETKIISKFKGEINGIEINNEGLYMLINRLLEKLCYKLKDADILKPNEFITDFIHCITNAYTSSDITDYDLETSIADCLDSFNLEYSDLEKLEFSVFDDYYDERLTNKYFGFINDRLISNYYIKK